MVPDVFPRLSQVCQRVLAVLDFHLDHVIAGVAPVPQVGEQFGEVDLSPPEGHGLPPHLVLDMDEGDAVSQGVTRLPPGHARRVEVANFQEGFHASVADALVDLALVVEGGEGSADVFLQDRGEAQRLSGIEEAGRVLDVRASVVGLEEHDAGTYSLGETGGLDRPVEGVLVAGPDDGKMERDETHAVLSPLC